MKSLNEYDRDDARFDDVFARPNAYIVQNDLPLPKPYGKFAPFKPSEPGSNMRHYHKPAIKPIQL
jgi:hypothetical protein